MVNGFKAKVFCNYSALKLILRQIAKERTENNFYNVQTIRGIRFKKTKTSKTL